MYFESYIQALENNVITIANPVKHRFLQRRKFTRIKFLEDLELKNGDVTHKVRTLDLSAGGMKVRTQDNIDIEKVEIAAQKNYDLQIDEIIFYDVKASAEKRKIDLAMVEKVAKVRALRETFVDDLGGMYEAEEMGINIDNAAEHDVVKEPEIIQQNEPIEEQQTIDVTFNEL